MKKSLIMIIAAVGVLFSSVSFADGEKAVASGTISFRGAIVATPCAFINPADRHGQASTECYNDETGKIETSRLDLNKFLQNGENIQTEKYTLISKKVEENAYVISMLFN